jgi:biotin carboxyl carrier protein
MKYTVRIDDKSYEVEIDDIHARPIIARVDGERFEVHPENGNKPEASKEAKQIQHRETPEPPTNQAGISNELTAPLPGTVVEIFVRPGDEIEVGKIVLVIEAMKMKNSIRSTRAGMVAEVPVSPGQTVTHKQALVRFAE